MQYQGSSLQSRLPQRPKRKRNRKKNQGNQQSRRIPRAVRVAVRLNRPKRGPQRRGPAPARSRSGQQRGNPMIAPFPEGNRSRTFRTCVVENDEYIGEILGCNSTTVPVIQTFPVNPGQVATFPWLSEQAAQWEKYRFEYLNFYYKPEVSGFATEGQSGKVILMMDYDASDPAPTTKQEMEDTDPHVDGMPYEDITLTLDPYDMFTDSDAKFVRIAGLPGGSDIKTYDVGNMTVMTLNNGGTNAVGELHVRYKVAFRVPVLEATKSTAPANNSVSWFQSTAAETGLVNGQAYTLLMATATTNGLAGVNTAGSIVLPAGNYVADTTVILDGSANTSGDQSLDVQLGGASLYHSASSAPHVTSASGVADYTELVSSVFFAANGTSALDVIVTPSFSSGTMSASGSIVISAV